MFVAQIGAFIIFKDLADISQWLVQSPREFTLSVWYNRYLIFGLSLVFLIIATVAWYIRRTVCRPWIFYALVVLFAVNAYSGMLNPALMFRSQQDSARMVSVDEAREYLQSSLPYAHFGAEQYDSVDDIEMLVVETDDGAYAFSDYYLLQPHVANAGTVDGKEVVMTYCGLTNLGVAYSPVIDGERLDLRAVTQLKNNLVMADSTSGDLVQQLWGHLESTPDRGRMGEVPSIRMPYRSFRELYPNGMVYVNEIAHIMENPMLALWDRVVRNGMMLWGVGMQWNRPDKAAFPTIENVDERLPMKQKVYTVSVGDDHVAYTKEFIQGRGGLINVTIGGRDTVISYDHRYDVVTAWHNHSGKEVAAVDVFGRTSDGRQLQRVNTLKSKLFWFIFAEFYPGADVNRT